jgi:hypothetical protein
MMIHIKYLNFRNGPRISYLGFITALTWLRIQNGSLGMSENAPNNSVNPDAQLRCAPLGASYAER